MGPKLCLLIGIPGTGKTTICNQLAQRLDGSWVTLHADDFIGPTFARFPGHFWADIRHLHGEPLGESAGWYMSEGGGSRSVLAEGHIKDRRELDLMIGGVRRVFGESLTTRVVCLDGDIESIVRNLLASPHRKHQFPELEYPGAKRADAFRSWITGWAIDPEIVGAHVNTDGKSKEKIADEAAAALGLPPSR